LGLAKILLDTVILTVETCVYRQLSNTIAHKDYPILY